MDKPEECELSGIKGWPTAMPCTKCLQPRQACVEDPLGQRSGDMTPGGVRVPVARRRAAKVLLRATVADTCMRHVMHLSHYLRLSHTALCLGGAIYGTMCRAKPRPSMSQVLPKAYGAPCPHGARCATVANSATGALQG